MRIAPKEAPKTGYNFGKGVYFADLAGKSAAYCATYLSNGIGLFVLCEVACGKARQLKSPDYKAASLPKGCHVTHALGRAVPDPKDTIFMDKGSVEVLHQCRQLPRARHPV